jgi:hypothetical integral membrane protein (TIGR02206 family)
VIASRLVPPFERFGAAHLAVLAATALLSVGLARAVGGSPDSTRGWIVRVSLVVLLLGLTGVFLAQAAARGQLRWWDFVPLQLCDMAIFVAAYALLSLNRLAAEIVYFWAGAGTLIAMLMPDLAAGFPSWEFVFFFGLHAAVLVSAAVLTFGFGLRPRRRAALRVLGWTNVYALGVGLVNVGTGSNFMYLRAKPQQASVLDWMGPWPFYLLGAELFALVLFLALERAAVRNSATSNSSLSIEERQ